MRHRRRRRLVMLADQHQHRHLDQLEFGPEVEFGQRIAGRCGRPPDRFCRNAARRSRIKSGCCAWNSGANSRRIATSVMAARPLAFDAAAMLRKASRPGSENAAPQSASTSRARDTGMANRHLQRHEPAIAVAEHDGIVAAGTVLHHLRHAVGDRREVAVAPPATGRSPAIPEPTPGTIATGAARWHRSWRDPTAASETEKAAVRCRIRPH